MPLKLAVVGLAVLALLQPVLCVTGKATYYNPAGGTGACGTTIHDSDMEAAFGYKEFGGPANPNNAPICHKRYNVKAPNGKSITVQILDKCEACDRDAPHIDLTAGAFKALGYPLSQGVIQGVTWSPA